MKIGMYMYDRELELDDQATMDFLLQYENAKDTMRQLLTMFEDEETRIAMFYMMSLRTLMDDFLEFCADGISADEMEILFNTEQIGDFDLDEFEEDDDDDEFEIFVDFDDEEE